MLTTKPRFATFAEYLEYEDDSEQLYELFNGELIALVPEPGLNFEIANFLFLQFALRILILALREKSYTEVGNFSREDVIISPGFPELELEVARVFAMA